MLCNGVSQESFPSGNWDRYDIFQFVGHQSGGISIWHAYDKQTKTWVVLKRIARGESVDKRVERELLNRNTLVHPHIVQLRHVQMTENTLDIFLESVPGRTMDIVLHECGFLREYRARRYFQQLVLAVDYCHKRGICVRNITLENLVLNEESDILKIYSFDLSKDLLTSVARSKVGSCDYMAPEMLRLEEYDGYAADMWECGVCLYRMIYGYAPFADIHDTDADRFEKTCERIQSHQLTISDVQLDGDFQDVPVSEEARSLLSRLLTHDPTERMTMKDVLKNPWFLECLPDGSLEMNAGVDPIDAKLISAHSNKPEKKEIEEILYQAAQTLEASTSTAINNNVFPFLRNT